MFVISGRTEKIQHEALEYLSRIIGKCFISLGKLASNLYEK